VAAGGSKFAARSRSERRSPDRHEIFTNLDPLGADAVSTLTSVIQQMNTDPPVAGLDPTSIGQPAGVQADERGRDVVFDIDGLSVSYGGNLALKDVTMEVRQNFVTAFIGPSGCGKSTFIRCFNRMNDLIPSAAVAGKVLYHGRDLYASNVDPVEVRRRIGMVFQKPNPFPKSVYENVAFGPRVLGMKSDLDGRVERALQHAALWDEVKDRLKENALGLSGGQQQRLCIARAIAIEPDVILMDEPASALDPISTSRIEDLIHDLKRDYTIAIVTHNMQQAARVADMTAFFSVELREDGTGRHGVLVEYDATPKIFTNPSDKRTEDYVTGRFG
jgi:phosphate transport system ATP-binding protein